MHKALLKRSVPLDSDPGEYSFAEEVAMHDQEARAGKTCKGNEIWGKLEL